MTSDRKKILIIEDEVILTQALETFLNMNYDVVVAHDGLEGFELAVALHPQIVLLDLFLPSMNGFEILESLKQKTETQDVPVLVLSNLAGDKDIEKAKQLGAVDYMVKANVDLEEIAAKVVEVIGN